MGKILIDQYVTCNSFKEAKEVSTAFENFSTKECYLGGNSRIRASRFIRKCNNEMHSHFVVIRYTINYQGVFCSYGFIDKKTIKRHPELPAIVEACEKDERWRVVLEYEEKDEFCNDIYFYKDFDEFFKNKLIHFMQRIDLACKVAFLCKCTTNYFCVHYEECGQAYERSYIANYETFGIALLGSSENPHIKFRPLLVQSVWDWSHENYYSKKNKQYSEARSWAALSYALNRDAYESLLYSIMGLEAVYTKDEKHVKEQLRQSVPTVFPYISAAEINELYKLRSDFVHGDISLHVYGAEWNEAYASHRLIVKSTTILLETIRLLVQNHATKIRVEPGTIRYICDRTLRQDAALWAKSDLEGKKSQ